MEYRSVKSRQVILRVSERQCHNWRFQFDKDGGRLKVDSEVEPVDRGGIKTLVRKRRVKPDGGTNHELLEDTECKDGGKTWKE